MSAATYQDLRTPYYLQIGTPDRAWGCGCVYDKIEIISVSVVSPLHLRKVEAGFGCIGNGEGVFIERIAIHGSLGMGGRIGRWRAGAGELELQVMCHGECETNDEILYWSLLL